MQSAVRCPALPQFGSQSQLERFIKRILQRLPCLARNFAKQQRYVLIDMNREVGYTASSEFLRTLSPLKGTTAFVVPFGAVTLGGWSMGAVTCGRGITCSADGMRCYVPVNILAADYSHVLQNRGVTLYAHTADNCLRIHRQPIPGRLREAAFSLDGLLERDTEHDPRICYTDTHGFTEVTMATAALSGFELAPRIKDIKDQTLYTIDRQQHYGTLDPILTGTVKIHLVRQAWDEAIRLIASIHERIVSASLILHRLGSLCSAE